MVDSFGQGRRPWCMKEPALIIHLTCATSPAYPLPSLSALTAAKFTATSAPEAETPFLFRPASEFVSDSFRWEQRLFTLVLDIAGVAGRRDWPLRHAQDSGDDVMAVAGSAGGKSAGAGGCGLLEILSALSLHAGGKLLRARSLKELLKCAESVCNKAHSAVARGVGVDFHPCGPGFAPSSSPPLRARLLVKTASGRSPNNPAARSLVDPPPPPDHLLAHGCSALANTRLAPPRACISLDS